jgi:hypothetical protein
MGTSKNRWQFRVNMRIGPIPSGGAHHDATPTEVFDLTTRGEALSRNDGPLERVVFLIPWEDFRPHSPKPYDNPSDTNATPRALKGSEVVRSRSSCFSIALPAFR